MRKETTTRTLCRFEELSEEVQEKAIERLYDLNVDYEWWACTYDDAKQIGLVIETFDIDRGSYVRGKWTESAEDVAKLIIKNHGKECETYKDAVNFLAESKNGEKIYKDHPDYDAECDYADSLDYETACEEFLRVLCEDYRMVLQKEYEYLTSREAIEETIAANEYEFTEDGKLA